MVLSVLRPITTSTPRVGLITSRRVGNAVVRNRVRRRLREIVRADRVCLLGDLWFVLIARQRAASAEFHELRDEWKALASRAAILRPAL